MAQTITEPKQPYEVFPILVDFAANMETGEIISSANSEVVAYDSAGEDISTDILDGNSITVIEGTKLQIVVKNGISGGKYKISFRAYINDSKKLEEDVILKVKD